MRKITFEIETTKTDIQLARKARFCMRDFADDKVVSWFKRKLGKPVNRFISVTIGQKTYTRNDLWNLPKSKIDVTLNMISFSLMLGVCSFVTTAFLLR